MKKLKESFPGLHEGFFIVLSDRLKEKGFTDLRLMDSINNLIDTCPYPTPSIANIISWDKQINLYTYDEMLKMNDNGMKPFEYHKRVFVSKIPLWARIDDIEKFNILTKLNETKND